MDMNLSKLQEIAEDRRTWRAAVHRVSRSWAQWVNNNKLLSPDVPYINHILAELFPYHLMSLCVRIQESIFRQFGIVHWFSGSKIKGFLVSFPLRHAGPRRHDLKSSGVYEDTEMGSIWWWTGCSRDSGGPTSLLLQLQMMPLRLKKNVKGICIQNENFKTCAGQMKYMLPAPGLEGP